MNVNGELELTGPETSSYVRVCELALGGMGRVDLALRREGAFRRLYAVKRLHSHLVTDPSFREMFMEEARVAGLIQHPNVVSVLDVGEDDTGPFLIMDFVDGLALSTLGRLAREREEPIPVQVAVRLARQIANGLHAAHEIKDHEGLPLGLVHRDLSPQNVLVGWDGTARITDFGIAKALGRSIRTSTGVLKGKMAYMSPEQLQFEEPDRRSDLFALGVILFEMLAGRRLYHNLDGTDGARRILREAPPDIGEERPEVPSALVQLSFELLAKDRERRPGDAATVATRLDEVLAEIVAGEGAIEVSEWMDDLAAEVRGEREEILARAVAEAESRPGRSIVFELQQQEQPRGWSRSQIVWIAMASAAMAVLGAAVSFSLVSETGSAGETPVAAPVAPATSTENPSASEDEVGSLEEAEDDPSPLDPAETGQAETVEQATMSRRRRARRRRPRMRAMTETPMMTSEGWDDWDSM